MMFTNDCFQLVWIGLYDDVNSWRWLESDEDVDGSEEMQFTNWKRNEPNNLYGKEHCGEMQSNGRWNDAPCSKTMKPICSNVRGEGLFLFSEPNHR